MKIFTEVSTPAADQLLVTLANLKIDLKITGSTEDTYLNRLIAQVSADISRYCGRVFKAETVVDTFYSTEFAGFLKLSRRPVISISTVSIDAVEQDSSLYLSKDEYGFLYPRNSSGYLIKWDPGIIAVTYSGGYSTIPADLEAACISLIKSERAAQTRDPVLRSEETPDVYKATYWVSGIGEGAFPPEISDTLGRFCRGYA